MNGISHLTQIAEALIFLAIKFIQMKGLCNNAFGIKIFCHLKKIGKDCSRNQKVKMFWPKGKSGVHNFFPFSSPKQLSRTSNRIICPLFYFYFGVMWRAFGCTLNRTEKKACLRSMRITTKPDDEGVALKTETNAGRWTDLQGNSGVRSE